MNLLRTPLFLFIPEADGYISQEKVCRVLARSRLTIRTSLLLNFIQTLESFLVTLQACLTA